MCATHGLKIPDLDARASWMIDCLRFTKGAGLAATALRLAGEMMLTIPEYHDEQAFPVGNTYGPVAMAFASPFLGSFKFAWQIDEHGARGMLAAVIEVDTAQKATLPDPYTALGLKGGMNCIWLSRQAGQWIGYVSQADSATACSESDPRTTLGVVATHDARHPADADYPPVVRFSEAATSPPGGIVSGLQAQPTPGQPLIGVRCINSWCELGPARPNGSPAFQTRDSFTGVVGREARIKGWHDEQWLSVEDAGGVLRPFARAAIVPAALINERSLADFSTNTASSGTPSFVRAATIYLRRNPAGTKYANGMQLREGVNHVEIRLSNNVWQAQVVDENGGNPRPLQLVFRLEHFDAGVPGTARFRWRFDDDGAWVPCGQACCRVEPQ